MLRRAVWATTTDVRNSDLNDYIVFSDPKCGRITFLWNVGIHLPDYTVLQPGPTKRLTYQNEKSQKQVMFFFPTSTEVLGDGKRHTQLP